MNSESFVAPTDLRDFLKAQGWTLVPEGLSHRLYVLNNERFDRRQLVFPMDLAAPDYEESVERVIRKLSELAGLSREVVYAQTFAINDVLRFRVATASSDSVLPLSFATTLVSGTEQLLKAAACTVLRPRAHHPRLSLAEATHLVEMARFGHTEPGSFVFKVACPVNAMEVQGSLVLDGANSPFVRQVTLALQRGLVQLVEAIEAGTLDSFVEAIKQFEDTVGVFKLVRSA